MRLIPIYIEYQASSRDGEAREGGRARRDIRSDLRCARATAGTIEIIERPAEDIEIKRRRRPDVMRVAYEPTRRFHRQHRLVAEFDKTVDVQQDAARHMKQA